MTLDDIAEIKVEYDRAKEVYLKASIYSPSFDAKIKLYRHWQLQYRQACVEYVEETLTQGK